MQIQQPIEIEFQSEKLFVYAIDAGVGDCILLHILGKNIKILIDSGPSGGIGRIKVKKALSTILSNDNRIDLAIVTHNDDDHIGGFPSLIKDKTLVIDTFFFNDFSYINEIFQCSDDKLSLKQDKALRKTIDDYGIKLKTFTNDDGFQSNEFFSFQGINFQFLSPNNDTLRKYQKHISDEVSISYEPEKFSSVPYDYSRDDFSKLIAEIKNNDAFFEDRSFSNGVSLAFGLEVGNRNFLFLGDAYPSVISEALRKSEKKSFDLCKLSHHGSDKNTSQELLSLFECNNFLICSNGEANSHPSVKTLARILVAAPDSRFYFSSNNNRLKEMIEKFSINSQFAEEFFLKLEYEL